MGFVRSIMLGNNWGDRHQHTSKQHEERPEDDTAQRHPRKVHRTIVTGHRGIDETHPHDAQLGAHHGQHQTNQSL